MNENAAPVDVVLGRLAELYPNPKPGLNFSSAFELLVATVLSAQTTDVRVNEVTPTLFAAYPNPRELAAADRAKLESILRPLGFYRNKARNLLGLSARLLEEYDGVVPGTLEELVSLPGVGRKTANVVLGNWFGVPGITVDTHLGRLTRRWGWTRETDPVKAERDLMEVMPREGWTMDSHRIIWHGRRVCFARKPNCVGCTLADICPSAQV